MHPRKLLEEGVRRVLKRYMLRLCYLSTLAFVSDFLRIEMCDKVKCEF